MAFLSSLSTLLNAFTILAEAYRSRTYHGHLYPPLVLKTRRYTGNETPPEKPVTHTSIIACWQAENCIIR